MVATLTIYPAGCSVSQWRGAMAQTSCWSGQRLAIPPCERERGHCSKTIAEPLPSPSLDRGAGLGSRAPWSPLLEKHMITNPTRGIALLVATLCTGGCFVIAAEPGKRPPREVLQRARPALEEAKRALDAQDPAGARAAVGKAITALGPWAGNPETATRYYPPVVTSPFSTAKATDWWLNEVGRGLRRLPWLKNPTGDPRKMAAGLREAAWPIDGLARTALLFPDQRDELTKHVRAGADWLIKLQHPTGVFPFPIGPGLDPREKVGHIVARAIREHPEIVVNDWIPDDFSDGGLQFDNGLCGSALVSAWSLTKDARYLAAARKSGDWAITRPLVPNWNYNAFSVGLLARLATATGDAKYLAAAVQKADAGVLPARCRAAVGSTLTMPAPCITTSCCANCWNCCMRCPRNTPSAPLCSTRSPAA